MVLDGEEHSYQFEGFDGLSNLTYTADFMHFAEGDYAVMSRSFSDHISYAQVSSRSETVFVDAIGAESDNLNTYLDAENGAVSFVISGRGAERSTSNPLGRNIHVEFQVQNQDISEEEISATLTEQFNSQQSCVYSDTDCWFSPNNEGDIIIPVDRHVYLDEENIETKNLIVDGTLEFFTDQDYHIKAENIIIKVGYELRKTLIHFRAVNFHRGVS
jgi:hypothetical protein